MERMWEEKGGEGRECGDVAVGKIARKGKGDYSMWGDEFAGDQILIWGKW